MKRGYNPLIVLSAGELFKKYMLIGKVAKELNISYSLAYRHVKKYFNEKSLIKCRHMVEKMTGRTFSQAHSSPKKLARIEKAFDLYRKLGTLDKVSKVMGVTRERVRQLLDIGTEFGLFHYNTRLEIYEQKKKVADSITKDQAADILLKEGKAGLVDKFGIDYVAARGVVTKFKLNTMDLRRKKRLSGIMKSYNEVVQQLGKHPSTLDLQTGTTAMRQINIDIIEHFGGIEQFRKDHGIQFLHSKKLHLPERMRRAEIFFKHRKSFIRQELQDYLEIGTSVACNLLRTFRRRGIIKKIQEGSIQNAFYEVIK